MQYFYHVNKIFPRHLYVNKYPSIKATISAEYKIKFFPFLKDIGSFDIPAVCRVSSPYDALKRSNVINVKVFNRSQEILGEEDEEEILLAVVDNFKMYSCRVHPAGIVSPSTVTRVPEDSKNVVKTASKDCHAV